MLPDLWLAKEHRKSGKAFLRRCRLRSDLGMCRRKERVLQIEAAACAKVLRSECTWFIAGAARELVGLESGRGLGDRVGDEGLCQPHCSLYCGLRLSAEGWSSSFRATKTSLTHDNSRETVLSSGSPSQFIGEAKNVPGYFWLTMLDLHDVTQEPGFKRSHTFL